MFPRYALAIPMLAFCGACARHPVRPPQSAVATRATAAEVLPGVLFLINGRALAAGHTLAELDGRYITSVEHLIGPAARPYLRPNFQEVYLITTSDTLGVTKITLP